MLSLSWSTYVTLWYFQKYLLVYQPATQFRIVLLSSTYSWLLYLMCILFSLLSCWNLMVSYLVCRDINFLGLSSIFRRPNKLLINLFRLIYKILFGRFLFLPNHKQMCWTGIMPHRFIYENSPSVIIQIYFNSLLSYIFSPL